MDEPLNPFACVFEDMNSFYKKELDIEDVVIEFKFKRMKRPQLKGYTRQLADERFLIAMAEGLEPSARRVTLAHELVHVWQMKNGLIDKSELEKHYLARSFELEAFRKSQVLAKKFFTEFKCEQQE